jgi:tRNA A37 threonylcarbamoyladenosine dehydratase
VTDEHLAGVWAVFSDEPPAPATAAADLAMCGVNCVCPGGDNPHHTCSRRRLILGSAMFVTAAFGMVAASAAVRLLLGMSPASPRSVCRKCTTPVARLRRPAGKA